jgi:hypothetical protein
MRLCSQLPIGCTRFLVNQENAPLYRSDLGCRDRIVLTASASYFVCHVTGVPRSAQIVLMTIGPLFHRALKGSRITREIRDIYLSPISSFVLIFPMARLARTVVAGLPHHVTQRGNRREGLFVRRGLFVRFIRQTGLGLWDSGAKICDQTGLALLGKAKL